MSALKIIARIRTDFPTKFGVPRQSGIVNTLKAMIVFEPITAMPLPCAGWKNFHIWLIWGFSEAERDEWSPTVRPPPRLGGNRRMGVLPPFPFPAECHRTFIGQTRNIGKHPEFGTVLYISGPIWWTTHLSTTSNLICPSPTVIPMLSADLPTHSRSICWKWNFRIICFNLIPDHMHGDFWKCWHKIRDHPIRTILNECMDLNSAGFEIRF